MPGSAGEARLAESLQYQSSVLGFYSVNTAKPLKAGNNLIKMVIWEAESGSTMKKELN